ncbi:glucose-6-phosphate isomerase [Moorella thermoacetica Y72]|uniref:Glucose-6-phosphate isomerase n=1 Tax=Moorella thermoacetica Y72 TaxID=1325331 RepID=A0A0S6UFW7_NEOTH|nr:bifunctional phosphoglucose/phosphomannose isomerase [Moorella thermoacetica]GAF26342.1 glucose-6-phosphate isomerase [Moorella thermoacetica Y72]
MYVDLDDLHTLSKLDSGQALQETINYPHQFREAWELAGRWPENLSRDEIRQIMFLGTGGGSAASVDLLASYLFDEIKVPLFLNRGYTIPASIDNRTLVVVVSHSGKTEEILNAYHQVCTTEAQIIVLTSGGKLLSLARENKHPYLLIPGGMMPRIAVGYIFLPLLGLLQRLGFVGDKSAEVKETINILSELGGQYGPIVPAKDNLAKSMAYEMAGYVPVVYGSLPLTIAVASRWKNQFAENSKLLAMYNALPALHHDEVAGWDAPQSYLRHFYFTFLQDAEDRLEITRRIEISQELLASRAAGVRKVSSVGKSRLARLFSLVYLGDFISLYLALIRGVDPTPVEIIDNIKYLLTLESRTE